MTNVKGTYLKCAFCMHLFSRSCSSPTIVLMNPVRLLRGNRIRCNNSGVSLSSSSVSATAISFIRESNNDWTIAVSCCVPSSSDWASFFLPFFFSFCSSPLFKIACRCLRYASLSATLDYLFSNKGKLEDIRTEKRRG